MRLQLRFLLKSCDFSYGVVDHSSPKIEFYEAADHRRLAVRVWEAVRSPRARAVFLHGVTSHGGWYPRSCHYLASAGCEVHFLDRRGSGLNRERPGDVDKWQTWVEDVTAYLKQIRGGPPAVLCGISWGGKLAAAVARREPGLMRGLALICPGLYSPYEPGMLKRWALAAPWPSRVQERRVRIPLRRPELFTESHTWREFIARDPLTLREITWRSAREDRRLTRYARQAAPLLHMPLLVMLAGRDRIIDNRRVVKFFRQTGAVERTLIEYPNASHTLEFEPDPAAYFADLGAWIAAVADDGALT